MKPDLNEIAERVFGNIMESLDDGVRYVNSIVADEIKAAIVAGLQEVWDDAVPDVDE